MRKRWIWAAAVVVVAALAFTGCARKRDKDEKLTVEERKAEVAGVDFSGSYQIEGEGYSGTLDIEKTGKGYHLEWSIGSETHYGKGIEMEGVLGAVFGSESGAAGVVAYKKTVGGITGLWAVAGGTELEYEKTKEASTLKASDTDVEGVYTVRGTNPNGSSYSGRLEILAAEEALVAQWLTGEDLSQETYGSGLVIDDVLVLAYGDDAGDGVAVYEIDDDELHGLWLYVLYEEMSEKSDIEIGTENAE